MSAYFEYLRELVTRFFSDLGRFFSKAFASPWADVPGNFEAYNSFLASHVFICTIEVPTFHVNH